MIPAIIKPFVFKIQESLKKVCIKIDQRSFGDKEFVVVANNCWGAEIYKRLDREYNTPFVGLFLYGADYLKLVENFNAYMASPLTFTEQSKWLGEPQIYPIGQLRDIEIHFLHYKDRQEALSKWIRRLGRMNKITDKNKYFFKLCDNALTTDEMMVRFHQLPFKNKISFSVRPLPIKNHIYVPDEQHIGYVPNGVRLYIVSYRYIDLLQWVKTGKFATNTYSRFKAFLRVS